MNLDFTKLLSLFVPGLSSLLQGVLIAKYFGISDRLNWNH